MYIFAGPQAPSQDGIFFSRGLDAGAHNQLVAWTKVGNVDRSEQPFPRIHLPYWAKRPCTMLVAEYAHTYADIICENLQQHNTQLQDHIDALTLEQPDHVTEPLAIEDDKGAKGNKGKGDKAAGKGKDAAHKGKGKGKFRGWMERACALAVCVEETEKWQNPDFHECMQMIQDFKESQQFLECYQRRYLQNTHTSSKL